MTSKNKTEPKEIEEGDIYGNKKQWKERGVCLCGRIDKFNNLSKENKELIRKLLKDQEKIGITTEKLDDDYVPKQKIRDEISKYKARLEYLDKYDPMNKAQELENIYKKLALKQLIGDSEGGE